MFSRIKYTWISSCINRNREICVISAISYWDNIISCVINCVSWRSYSHAWNINKREILNWAVKSLETKRCWRGEHIRPHRGGYCISGCVCRKCLCLNSEQISWRYIISCVLSKIQRGWVDREIKISSINCFFCIKTRAIINYWTVRNSKYNALSIWN